MENLKVTLHEQLPYVRYMNIDTLVRLTFDANLKELEVAVTTTSSNANIQMKKNIVVSELIHTARISEEEHVFPILRSDDFRVYISFDELKGYLAVCEMCEIEPDPEVCENARAAEAES